MAKHGSVPTGPSKDYLRLLKREISPEQYAQRVKRRLREDRSERGAASSNGAQAQDR